MVSPDVETFVQRVQCELRGVAPGALTPDHIAEAMQRVLRRDRELLSSKGFRDSVIKSIYSEARNK